jgi:hypothetical protein
MNHESTHPPFAICTYRVKKDREAEFLSLLSRHWPLLRDLEMAEDEPSLVFQGIDETGGVVVTEILTWKDGDQPHRAHEVPSIMALWEPMGMCCESRMNRPAMEFPQVRKLELHGA